MLEAIVYNKTVLTFKVKVCFIDGYHTSLWQLVRINLADLTIFCLFQGKVLPCTRLRGPVLTAVFCGHSYLRCDCEEDAARYDVRTFTHALRN